MDKMNEVEKHSQSPSLTSETASRQRTRSPLADFTARRKGDKLYIKPKLSAKFKATFEEKCSFEGDEKDVLHQRSATTIINDITQSYTFAPGFKKTQESLPEEDSENSFERLYNELKDSVMGSTMDPKSRRQEEKKDSVLTISSLSQESLQPEKNSLMRPVVAFCGKCQENIETSVVENVYVGGL
jgi:hypothetical protein